MEIKDRMEALGISQVDMILKLKERGMTVSPPMMSQILRGVYDYPKGKAVLMACEEVLTEHERSNPV